MAVSGMASRRCKKGKFREQFEGVQGTRIVDGGRQVYYAR